MRARLTAFAIALVAGASAAGAEPESAVREQHPVAISGGFSMLYGFIPIPALRASANLAPRVALQLQLESALIMSQAEAGLAVYLGRSGFSPYAVVRGGVQHMEPLDGEPSSWSIATAGLGVEQIHASGWTMYIEATASALAENPELPRWLARLSFGIGRRI